MFLNTSSKLGQVAVSLPSQAFNISTDGDCMVSSAKLFSLWKTFPLCPAFPCCSVCLLPFAIMLYSPEDSEEFLHTSSLTRPSARPVSGWHPYLRCLLLPDGWGLQPQRRSGNEMNGARGMCWAALGETLAAITTSRQWRNIFQIFSLCVIFLSQAVRAFSYSSAPSMRLVSLVTLCHTAYSSHVFLHPLHLFLPFLGYLWPSPRKSLWSIRSLLKIAGPQVWHRCKRTTRGRLQTYSRGQSPIRIQLLAYIADNKVLMYLMYPAE